MLSSLFTAIVLFAGGFAMYTNSHRDGSSVDDVPCAVPEVDASTTASPLVLSKRL